MPPVRKAIKPKTTETYQHPEADLLMRPEVGTQAQFKKKKVPQTYRYDSSLSPQLELDGQNPARELGESQLSVVSSQLSVVRSQIANAREKLSATDHGQLTTDPLDKAEEALRTLKSLSKPFLNWSGKAERLSFDVPTLPLFIHERLSTKAIIETLKGDYEESVWDHLAGTVSAPFAAGKHGQIAVKVIDQRGNELLVVKSLKEAGK